jgi:hypothetical protein
LKKRSNLLIDPTVAFSIFKRDYSLLAKQCKIRQSFSGKSGKILMICRSSAVVFTDFQPVVLVFTPRLAGILHCRGIPFGPVKPSLTNWSEVFVPFGEKHCDMPFGKNWTGLKKPVFSSQSATMSRTCPVKDN